MNTTATSHASPPCRTASLAQPPGSLLDIDLIAAITPVTRRCLHPGQHLYRAGQPFNAVYFVHAGFLRTSVVTGDGREQVTGFPMRGDLVGVESIGSARHAGDAVALDTCEIVELAYPAVLAACTAIPTLNAVLMQALARELRRDRHWMLALGTLSAEQRVAAFLLDLATRHGELGFSASRFALRMSRIDIGNFLALKHETVTRALSHLAALGLIAVDRREIRLCDAARLGEIAAGGTDRALAA